MHKRAVVVSATVVVAAVVTLMLAFSAQAVSVAASINPIGVVAAAFAGVVGVVWFVKNR